VIQLRRISLLFVLGFVVFTLAGCGEVETNEKTLMDGSKSIIDLYVIENGYKIIPPEKYFPKEIGVPDGINISERPNDVWELSEIREVTIQSGDTLVDIINPYFMNEHFRMNYGWYAKQVLKLNNITDPHFIKAGETLKIPIYIDKGAKENQKVSADL